MIQPIGTADSLTTMIEKAIQEDLKRRDNEILEYHFKCSNCQSLAAACSPRFFEAGKLKRYCNICHKWTFFNKCMAAL